MTIGDLDEADNVLFCAGEYDAIRARNFHGPVVFVKHQILRLVQHRIGAEELFQVLKEPGFHGFIRVWPLGVALLPIFSVGAQRQHRNYSRLWKGSQRTSYRFE